MVKRFYRKSKGRGRLPLSKAQTKAIKKIATKSIMRTAETKMLPVEHLDQKIGPDDACMVFSDLNQISQGSDNENRIGDEIIQRGLQMCYSVGVSTASEYYYFIRVLLVSADKGEGDSTSDTFLTSTANEPKVCTANDSMDILRSINRKQLKVHFDKVHSLRGGVNSGPNHTHYKKFLKLRGKRYFPNDASNESEHATNLRLVVIVRDSDGNTIPAGNDINFNFYSRYYYKDI